MHSWCRQARLYPLYCYDIICQNVTVLMCYLFIVVCLWCHLQMKALTGIRLHVSVGVATLFVLSGCCYITWSVLPLFGGQNERNLQWTTHEQYTLFLIWYQNIPCVVSSIYLLCNSRLVEGLAMGTIAGNGNYGHFCQSCGGQSANKNTVEQIYYFLYLGFVTRMCVVFYSTCMWLNVVSSPALSGSSLFQIFVGT
jgi:hypothetical protein